LPECKSEQKQATWIRKKFDKWSVTPIGLFFYYSAPLFVVVFGVALVVAVFWPLIFTAFWSKFQAVQDRVWVRCVIVTALIGVACCLYFIRRHARSFYGLVEVIIGISACWIILRNTQAERLTVIIALTGSVYVIVRGIDNYIEGRNQRSGNQRMDSY
jgi:hypothetical protein